MTPEYQKQYRENMNDYEKQKQREYLNLWRQNQFKRTKK